MSVKRVLAVTLSLLCLAPVLTAQQRVGATRAFMLSLAGAEPIADVQRLPLALQKPVTIVLKRVTVEQALREIIVQAHLSLSYSRMVVPLGRLVTVDVRQGPVVEALRQAVAGAPIELWLAANGRMVLVPASEGVATEQMGGTIAGRVLERGTNVPVASAQVTVAGTGLTRYTDDKGQYRIPNVPAGEHEVTVKRLGFEPASRTVRVGDGETVTVDFAMARVPTTLTEMVTTATGERSRLEVGNSIGTIKADSLVPTTLIRNMSDLLQARMPGVVVTNSTGRVGAPSKIRIRGINSLQLNNDPIIILDGVRLNWLTTTSGNSVSSQTNTGSTNTNIAVNIGGFGAQSTDTPSRLDDIDPNTIESIDVLRGPSAASLYGTEAANGVIVIKTKKGGVGSFRLNVLADQGRSSYPGQYPPFWRGWGSRPTGAVTNLCFVLYLNNCRQDSVTAFNGVNDPYLSGLGTGTAQNVSVNLSGGSQQLQEFLSLRGSDLVGIAKLSQAEQNRIVAMRGASAPAWMMRPNAGQDIDATSRTTLRVNPELDIQLSANGIYRNVRSSGDGIPTSSFFYLGSWDTLATLPAEFMRQQQTQQFKRGFVSSNANYTPASWLTLTATLGGDYTLRTDNTLQRASDCTAILAPATGCVSAHGNIRSETFVTTMNLGAQLNFAPRPWLGLRTALGEQYSGTTFYELNAGNSGSTNLAFGTDLLTPSPVAASGTPQLYSVTESRDQSATAGWYVEQTVSLRERLFLTAALRQDAASAFGPTTNRQLPTYPKFSLSWVASDEPFFPYTNIISSFRLRAAYGHSGNQARQTDVLPNYRVATDLVDNATVPGIVLSQIPNPSLRPERAAELEGGFDLSLFTNERVHFEATMYRKLSQDAIIGVNTPGSYGAVVTTQRVNLGSVENRGLELALTTKLIDARTVGWDVAVNYSVNNNKLVTFVSQPRLVSSNSTSFLPGYPLFGYWTASPVSWYDLNGDGVLQPNEIAWSWGTEGVPLDSQGGFVYLGPPYPKSEISYNSGLSLLSGAIRFNALADQVSDFMTYSTQQQKTQCYVAPTQCTLGEQALVIRGGQGGILSRVSYTRLSEVSATYNLSKSMAHRYLHAQSAAVTFAGRNLALWSNYLWKDPSVLSLNDQQVTGDGDGKSYGQPRTWTLRLNLGF